jgi:hypothetical protein
MRNSARQRARIEQSEQSDPHIRKKPQATAAACR